MIAANEPREQVVAMKLKHAVTFIRHAREAKFEEIRKQDLDEAERLIEAAATLLGEKNG